MQRLCLLEGGGRNAFLRFLPAVGMAGDRAGGARGGDAWPPGPACSLAPFWGCSPSPSPPSSQLCMVPGAKPPVVLGQKWCKAMSVLLWFSSTGVTLKGCPEQGLGLPAALFSSRDHACSWGGWIAIGGEPGPSQPPRRAGFTSVIWVTDKATLGLCLCVTAGFLRSSAVSAAARFQILPSGAAVPARHPLLVPRSAAVPSVPPGNPTAAPGWLGCLRQGGCAGRALRACSEGFGFPFSLAGWPGGSSFNTKSCGFLN